MTATTHTRFDFGALTAHERYKILTGTIVPRPIALVTTVDRQGRVNAAPISFFNCMGSDPATLVLGVARRSNGEESDTGRNIRATGVFTVNTVSRAILHQMNICAIPFAPGVEELAEAGLATLPGDKVPVPRVAGAPAAFECRQTMILSIGPAREIILGEVLAAHVRADPIDDRLHTDQHALDAVGRMGGATYAFARDLLGLDTPSLAAWEGLRGDAPPPPATTAAGETMEAAP